MMQLLRQLKAADNRPDKQTGPVTLCRLVDPSRAIVLPKMRVSQRGITIRSFSHHLALLNGTEVEPVWNPTPDAVMVPATDGPFDEIAMTEIKHVVPTQLTKASGPYNFILLPIPHDIKPSQFVPVEEHLRCLGGRPPDGDQFFKFIHRDDSSLKDNVERLIESAKSIVGKVDGLILPEMAMTIETFNYVFGEGLEHDLNFIACGVYEPPAGANSLGRNYAIIRKRSGHFSSGDGLKIQQEQCKHHRWALDPSQVAAYALGSSLRPKVTWWEGIDLPKRKLHFFALDSFASFAVLICEDLARPDPVADAVRAVGPNLVICLLLDGPQLATRWSARYATVLADDPGSSVLTLSSLGMVKLSRTRDKLHKESRVIGLWRESGGAPVELHLPNQKDALLLSLSAQGERERTIDGRHDDGMAASLKLAGVHALSWR